MKRVCILLTALLLIFSAAAPAEEFSWRVSAPNGAPALSLAVMAAEKPENYVFIAPDTIGAEFTKAESDFIIAPINAGAKLFKAGKSNYRLGAVVTWGNLYFASQRDNFTPESINNARVTLFGENTINASVALCALKLNGIVPETIDYLAGAAETKAVLESDPEAMVLTAEPMLTAAKLNNDRISGFSVNELLEKANGMTGYAQAGLFVRSDTLEKNPEIVSTFLNALEESCDCCTKDPDRVVSALNVLEMKFPKPAIANCSIRFVSAAEAREMIEKTAMIDLSQFGGELPSDDFYYAAE